MMNITFDYILYCINGFFNFYCFYNIVPIWNKWMIRTIVLSYIYYVQIFQFFFYYSLIIMTYFKVKTNTTLFKIVRILV